MNKNTLIIFVILLAIIITAGGYFMFQEYNQKKEIMKSQSEVFMSNNAKTQEDSEPLNSEEIKQGWYWWADKNTKRKGTPDGWLYINEGTRSAQWADPNMSINEIIEIKDFSCSGMVEFTFKYPVFKGWEAIGENSQGGVICNLFLNSGELEKRGIHTEVAPQIEIMKGLGVEAKIGNEIPKNINNIPYDYDKEQNFIQFFTPNFPVSISLEATYDEYGFSKDKFFKTVIESFKLTSESSVK